MDFHSPAEPRYLEDTGQQQQETMASIPCVLGFAFGAIIRNIIIAATNHINNRYYYCCYYYYYSYYYYYCCGQCTELVFFLGALS